ncbi:MAG: glycosyl hydrolase family 28-related protein [Pseudomonadota bacterium]
MSSTITDRSSGLGTGAIPNGENATISQKVPCRVATTANITLSGLQIVDAVTVEADDRVLVKDQTDAAQNGIYLAGADAWRRSNDCVDAGDLVRGSQVRVNEGATGAGSWYCTSDDPIAIGNDNITWVDVATTVLTGAEIKALYEAEADTNAFEDADAAKLDGIEPSADVTDTANVTAAGALMESEVDADIKTFSLPANTTISLFGASLVGETSADTARTTLSAERAVTANVLDHGAVGDGTTNDAAAFSAACTEAGANGIVVVPGGHTYNLGAQVSITQPGLTLIGVGKPTLLRGANTSPIRIAADRVEVSGLRIDGQKATFLNSSSCIRVDNVDDWKVLNND